MNVRHIASFRASIARRARLMLPAAAVTLALLTTAVAAADTPAGLGKLPAGADTDALNLINARQAQLLGFTGEGTSVVVLDSGVNWKNPAFACTEVDTPVNVCRVVLSADMNKNDWQLDAKHGHGTNVSGIIASVAPGTRLFVIDVFDKGDNASDRAILGALNWVLINKRQYNIVAVNMSLGSMYGYNKKDCTRGNQYVSAFAQLRGIGVMPVVAAGNEAMVLGTFVNGIGAPACTPGAVSVGAVYKADAGRKDYRPDCSDPATRPDQIACFSQTGPTLGLLAPGGSIRAAGITMSGTSQATPHVAGAVAALASRCPRATVTQLETALETTGPVITDARNGVAKHRLDVLAAGAQLAKQGLCG